MLMSHLIGETRLGSGQHSTSLAQINVGAISIFHLSVHVWAWQEQVWCVCLCVSVGSDVSCIPGRNVEVRGHSRCLSLPSILLKKNLLSYCAPLHTPDHLVSELRGISGATTGVTTDMSLHPALCGSGDLNLGARVCRSRIFPSELSLQYVDAT